MSDSLIIFGSGGHAKVVAEAVLARTPRRKIIILDDAARPEAHRIFGFKVSGTRTLLSEIKPTPVALGIGNNAARYQLMQWLREHAYQLESVIHPRAIVAPSVQVREGAFVGAGAVVIAESQIGAGAIINTAASVDHDCIIGEAAHVAPGVHLCGNVFVGARVLVGVGSSICPGISICDDALLGAGSVVVRDISIACKFAGNPARPLPGN